MSVRQVQGNLKGLSRSQSKLLEKFKRRRIESSELVSFSLARELVDCSRSLGRMLGLLVSREGEIKEIIVGTKTILYLPDLGRYRLGEGRLRRLRLIVTNLTDSDTDIVKSVGTRLLTSDLLTDLEKLRLDAVVALKSTSSGISAEYAYIKSSSDTNYDTSQGGSKHLINHQCNIEFVKNLGSLNLDFEELIYSVESEIASSAPDWSHVKEPVAVLVSVSSKSRIAIQNSVFEMEELGRTAGLRIVDTVIQRRRPDPRSVLGTGKLESVVLHCLRIGADILIFDRELLPTQWRTITRLTDLKVIDRSMLILDIFAQRAKSNEGRMQVELAQLKYNLPRLTDKDTGLSRLTGGIGGRGPGETKLEISRRRSRDKIKLLEDKLKKVSSQRELKSKRRLSAGVPLASLVGYTNAGKSSIFKKVMGDDVYVADQLFATLDTTQRRYTHVKDNGEQVRYVVSDTVGFIRDLPNELVNAFKATLDELFNADLLLHVVDISEPEFRERISSVNAILAEIGINSDMPYLMLFNKVDLVDENIINEVKESWPDGVFLSAVSGEGIDILTSKLSEQFDRLSP